MELSIDEVIIQYRKGNEEAIELLFLLFGKHFAVLENKFKISGTMLGYTRYDIRNIIQMETIDLLKLYEFDKSNFFAYWKLILTRKFYNLFESYKSETSVFNNIYSIDDNFENIFCNFNEEPLQKYIMRDSYQDCINIVKDNSGNLAQKIIILWSEGYSYQDIARITKMSINQVCYLIYKSLKMIKEKYKK